MKSLRYGISLVALFVLYYLVPLNFRLLWQPDETRYAEISREMLATGDWVVPHFLGLRYFEKPIAGYWINSIGQWLFGHNNFAVRFGVVFSITVSRCWWSGWRGKSGVTEGRALRRDLLNRVPGLRDWHLRGARPDDHPVDDAGDGSFWLAASAKQPVSDSGATCCWVACGMGVMTKGFLALAVPVIGVLPWVIARKRWREVLIWGWLSVLVCVLTVLPWGLAIAEREGDFWRYFFWVEHIQRFAQSDAQHKAPFWYYIPFLIAGSLPWLALLPGALKRGWREREGGRGAVSAGLGCHAVPVLQYRQRQAANLYSAVLCAAGDADGALCGGGGKTGAKALRVNGIINIVFGVVGLIAVAVVSPWGPMKHPVWMQIELYKCVLAAVAFFVWALMGWLSIKPGTRRWTLAALCPLGLALLVGLRFPTA
jgi:4-amino-4-deoxy-L-arabinose transferase